LLSKSTYVNLFQREGVVRHGLADRMEEINAKYLCKEERDILSKILVRHIDDPEFELHCQQEHCGPDCEFALHNCTNEGCDEFHSQKYLIKHAEQDCKFKLVDCPNRCGEQISRNSLRYHVRQTCPLRDASCPFKFLGCPAVVQAKNTTEHLQAYAVDHFTMVASGMEEFQEQIKTLNKRIEHLEYENGRLKQDLEVRDTTLRKEIDALSKELRRVHKEAYGAQKEAGRLSKNLKQLQNDRSHVK